MKPYFPAICKLRKPSLILFSIVLFSGCYPGVIVPSKVDVITKKPLQQFVGASRLVILPFESPEPALILGTDVALVFEEHITKKNFFKEIMLVEDSQWIKQIDFQNQKMTLGISEADSRQADFMLFGIVEKFMHGIATDTHIIINVKLIHIATEKTVWWGRHKVVGKQGNTFLLFGKFLSPNPPGVQKLLQHATKQIVSDIFSGVELQNKPGFLKRIFANRKPHEHGTTPPTSTHNHNNGTQEKYNRGSSD